MNNNDVFLTLLNGLTQYNDFNISKNEGYIVIKANNVSFTCYNRQGSITMNDLLNAHITIQAQYYANREATNVNPEQIHPTTGDIYVGYNDATNRTGMASFTYSGIPGSLSFVSPTPNPGRTR